jgi:hypothetical protein
VTRRAPLAIWTLPQRSHTILPQTVHSPRRREFSVPQ